ncbi:MAG: hypothetical protein GF411_06075 [Candidatus Lokiarchaeota archaeon]|nr:hypothetical protein [Candidatus Lokiarchaeota archaeon]
MSKFDTTEIRALIDRRHSQITIEKWMRDNIFDMDIAEKFGREVVEVSHRAEFVLGALFLHVEEHQGGRGLEGGKSELARRLEIPRQTAQRYEQAFLGLRRLEEKMPSAGQVLEIEPSKLALIESSPEPDSIMEDTVSRLDRGEVPSYREIEAQVTEQRLQRQREILDSEPSTKYRPEPLQYTNVWEFIKTEYDFDDKHSFGNAFPEVLEHILYYFTEPGDCIVDPMAGMGFSKGICNQYHRNCLMYDIEPRSEDITYNDMTEGLPEEAKGCDLIYLDPPYFNIRVKDAYNGEVEDFYEFIKRIAEVSYDTVKLGGKVAFMMMDKTIEEYQCLTAECYRIFREVGFACIMRVSSPYPEHIVTTGFGVNYARTEKKLVGRDRVIYIFQKDSE